MYRRLIILSLIIFVAFCGLSWLGYRAISMWTQGIEGTRISEFADVADQIRIDVNETLDAFKLQEQNRPYTDYQYYTISEEPILANQQIQLDDTSNRRSDSNFRAGRARNAQDNNINISNQRQITYKLSPLANDIEHDLAYFYFQYDKDSNTLTSPNGRIEQDQTQFPLNELVENNLKNVQGNLIPVLENLESKEFEEKRKEPLAVARESTSLEFEKSYDSKDLTLMEEAAKKESLVKESAGLKANTKVTNSNRMGSFNVDSLQRMNEEPQIQTQSRDFVNNNILQNGWSNVAQQEDNIERYESEQQSQQSYIYNDELVLNSPAPRSITSGEMQQKPQNQTASEARGGRGGFGGGRAVGGAMYQSSLPQGSDIVRDQSLDLEAIAGDEAIPPIVSDPNQGEMVEVVTEWFSPIMLSVDNNNDTIFGGQLFMVRRVKIEGQELYQGFQLNEKRLLARVEESTKRFLREGMSYELGRKLNGNSDYTAILDFGFGHLLLNLFENDPGRIVMQINHLRNWYFSIIAIVFLAVTMAVVSLWLNARAQIKLAQKKDDFVSAVSHELRTPLTSIRMHAEMLEKNWVKSPDKLGEYYRSMRTESERLSRLIENVLDFSRIQKGRKKFLFKLGDINKCVADVVEMMRAYSAQKGFQIIMQPGECGEIAFDSDAVTQIVVNLIDNAVKYSSDSQDKSITIRTKSDGQYVSIEVEDHGPGIPHGQRNKIFQEFYRIGAESTRETAGSGLGLALVKKFAQAHNGFVEIINARPTGAIFRVSLAAKLQDNL